MSRRNSSSEADIAGAATPSEDNTTDAATPFMTYPAGPELVAVTMAHFHTYNGRELQPGDVVTVDPDTAKQWAHAGYVQPMSQVGEEGH